MSSQSKIPELITNSIKKLVQQMIPTISKIVEKTGIQNIGQPNLQLPNLCLLQDELQEILKLRNTLVNKLNSTASIIERLSKSLNPLTQIVNTTEKTLKTVHTARIIANKAITFIPSPPGTPGAVISTINTAKDLEEFLQPKITIAKNSLTLIKTALDYANSTIFKLVNMLKSIDQYLNGCGVNLTDSPSFNDYVKGVDIQYTQVQNLPNDKEVYKGFTLEIVKEQYTPTTTRRKAVAKNQSGIILLQTPLSFTTLDQVLISEIKLIIDSNNLKAD